MKLKFSPLLLIIFIASNFTGQTVTKLSSDQFRFIEGPAWDGSEFIYFSDVITKKIHKYSVKSKTFALAFDNFDDGCNGLMFNKNYNLIVCGFKGGNVKARKPDGTLVKTLFSEFKGKRFDNPNDICIDAKGGMYFTDPTRRNPPFQAKRSIYYVTPKGKLTVADDENYSFPNGVLISNNGKYLYTNDSDSHNIYKYKIKKNGKICDKSIFATITNANNGDEKSRADGMATDIKGNLYITSKKTVQVFNNNGNLINTITFPENTTNCTFGGADKKTLFVTATKNLYSVKLDEIGFQHPIDFN